MAKKILFWALILGVAAVPVVSWAAQIRSGPQVSFSNDEIINDDLYVAGGSIQSSARVEGDVIVAGGTISISGPTTQDVTAAGGSIAINGAVGDDLRVAGGSIAVASTVADDVIVAGGQVTISPDSNIGGDAVISGGQVRIDGNIRGNVQVNAGQLTIGSTAVISGKLTYTSQTEARIQSGAQIIGGVDFRRVEDRPQAAAVGTGIILRLLTLFVTALLIQWIFRGGARRLVRAAATGIWGNIGWGLVILVVSPIIILLLFITVIGIPVALIALLSYIILLIFAYLFIPVFLGGLVMRYYRRRQGRVEGEDWAALDWKSALVGAAIVTILGLIPIIGWLANLIFFLIILGALVRLARGMLMGNDYREPVVMR